MDQAIRNRLRNVVTQCRKLLEQSVGQALQGQFGIQASGKKDDVQIEDESRMSHLADDERTARKEIIDHFEHIKARGFKPKEALDQLIREIAFTHLNRLCAYKMMEARDVYVGGQKFREAVSRGVNSNGFKFYLADHAEDERVFSSGKQDVAYRHFLNWLGGTMSEEIGVLFSPTDPANRLYPPQRVLDEVISLLNTGDIKPEDKELAEAWPQIWSQDETIGWVYQYFTPKELRDQARKESAAPRNSYELAFRNQFFTPRYVVEFLTDNTLGRIWYEMRKGETKLKDQCRYMVRRPNEIFLGKGEEPPKEVTKSRDDLSQEELLKQPVYVPHRPKKDLRDLNMLDPSSGSGHFLLYCFDLLETIYEEAYDDPDLGPALKKQYPTLADLRKAVPGLILSRNLYGIDIDLRCTQIAALALWLRCQRAYQEMGLNKDRPKITRSNIVCAEPMPGEEDMLREFVSGLQPRLLGQLVEAVFAKMKLAGEAGSLLKIEEELREAIATSKRQWLQAPKQEQLILFDTGKRLPRQLQFDLSGITDEAFWTEAEAKVLVSLREYATKVSNGRGLQRQLFAEDAAQGFALIDLFQQKYDVVLMNPPFGAPIPKTLELLNKQPELCGNLFSAFVVRGKELLLPSGMIGAITDRSFVVKETYEDYREWLFKHSSPRLFVDLGWEVLDANVEACAYIIVAAGDFAISIFSSLSNIFPDDIGHELRNRINSLNLGKPSFILASTTAFESLPHRAMSYWLPPTLLSDFTAGEPLDVVGGKPARGMSSGNTAFACRLLWEVPEKLVGSRKQWNPVNVGGGKAAFFRSTFMVFYYADNWEPMRRFPGFSLKNTDLFWRPAIGWGKRTDVLSTQLLPDGMITAEDGQVFVPYDLKDIWVLLGFLNSRYAQAAIHCICGGHKGPGYLGKVPYPRTLGNCDRIESLARESHQTLREISCIDETSPDFLSPLIFADGPGGHSKPASHGHLKTGHFDSSLVS